MVKLFKHPIFWIAVFYVGFAIFFAYEFGHAVEQFQGYPGWHKIVDWWTKP